MPGCGLNRVSLPPNGLQAKAPACGLAGANLFKRFAVRGYPILPVPFLAGQSLGQTVSPQAVYKKRAWEKPFLSLLPLRRYMPDERLPR